MNVTLNRFRMWLWMGSMVMMWSVVFYYGWQMRHWPQIVQERARYARLAPQLDRIDVLKQRVRELERQNGKLREQVRKAKKEEK